jgi:hypothetical protein
MENFANRLGYSDIEPFEVIRVVSAKCLEVRAMDSERDPAYKPEFVAGGFSAVCLNQNEQKWIIKSNPDNRVMRIRLQKRGDWKSACGGRFALRDKPVRYYDYNF